MRMRRVTETMLVKGCSNLRSSDMGDPRGFMFIDNIDKR